MHSLDVDTKYFKYRTSMEETIEMNRTSGIITALFVVAIFAFPIIGIAASSDVEGDGFISYYDQLDENGKAVYDAMKEADAETHALSVDLPVTLMFSSDDVAIAEKYLRDTVNVMVNDAYFALRLSSPMSYWGWMPSIVDKSIDIQTSGNTVFLTSIELTVKLGYYPNNPETGEFDGIQPLLDDLKKAVDDFKTESTSVRDKVMDINNYITGLVTYDPNMGTSEESRFAHDAYGALVDPDHYAVCDGYSKAFLLLCEKEGIDCVVVLGTALPNIIGHAWNYVKMDNGNWYAMDVTWNDNTSNSYFLLGSDTFFATHQQGVFLENGITPYTFDSPPVNKTKYDPSPRDYSNYAWILAAVIAAILIIALIRFARGSK